MNFDEYKEDIRAAVEVMNRGGVILYPTDTIGGIGCDATNAEAVKRVYEIKKRDDSKALITLVDSEAKIEFYVREVPDVAWDMIEIADKPLTLIYDGAQSGTEPAGRGRKYCHTPYKRAVQQYALSYFSPCGSVNVGQRKR